MSESQRVESALLPGARLQPTRRKGLRMGGFTFGKQRGRFARVKRDTDPGCSPILIEFHVFSQQISPHMPIHLNFLSMRVVAPTISRMEVDTSSN